jgi:hypothetical protein
MKHVERRVSLTWIAEKAEPQQEQYWRDEMAVDSLDRISIKMRSLNNLVEGLNP